MTERVSAAKRARLRVAEQLRVVLYLRVSKPGEKSIGDQEKVARRDVAALGGVVVAVFSDKMSASRYRRVQDRPGFINTQDFISSGGADMLWTFASNRAARDLDDYVPLRRLCIQTGTLWRYGGKTLDLAKSADRRAANADALRAEEFSDDQSDAINRGIQEALQDGLPHGRLARGFRIIRDPDTGEPINREPIPEQATVIRRAAELVLDPAWSGSLSLVARQINPAWKAAGGRGVFDLRTLRKLLINPTYAGKRTYKGEIERDGTWEAILTFEQHQRLCAVLRDPSRRTHRGTAPTHLLSYIATCGATVDGRVCGRPVSVKNPQKARPNAVPSYRCGKGHVSRPVELVERHVEELLLSLLEDPETQRKLIAKDEASRSAIDAELATIAELRANIAAYVKDAAKTRMSAQVVAAYVEPLEDDIAKAQARLKTLTSPIDPALEDLLRADVRATWFGSGGREGLSIERRRAAVRATMSVVILPMRSRGYPDDIGVEVEPLGALA
ncbi:recombinase family protein [Nocardia sp. NPDC049149]|uniref:recombinase family protein n=1 Tax=Nocardia sp. NPDC049149 TaxID=3364315 RepID=UPI00371FCBDD